MKEQSSSEDREGKVVIGQHIPATLNSTCQIGKIYSTTKYQMSIDHYLNEISMQSKSDGAGSFC